jgi:hypothetical protein
MKKSISSAKKKAWFWFSKYIRLRDGLITMGSKEYGKCFTCDRITPLWSRGGMQAGHFVDGRSATVLFDEKLVHGQCYACNVSKNGNKDAYTPRMIKKYGLRAVQSFWDLKNNTRQWTIEDLEEIEEEYKTLYTDAMENN